MFYQDEPLCPDLEQGDILRKSKELAELLDKYHPYYAQHADNALYVVLTQSCDLVRRDGAACSSRYISIAPARPLKAVLQREFSSKLENIAPGSQPYAGQRTRTSIEQFLEKLFNNNEPPFFYLEQDNGRGIYTEMCAMLALSITLKAEHYETFLNARLASVQDVFQAKIGWLVGQIYSRVGTRDLFDKSAMSKKVKEFSEGWAIWVDDNDLKVLRGSVRDHKAAHPENPVDKKILADLLGKIPKRKANVIEAVLEIATELALIENPSPRRRAFRRALENNTKLAALFK